ncbi:PREDICTED: paladin-like [Camelina sativa]|uniref:Paladin-like n=1 Tax=Camelina sativa TaxID=90675 RepID=A0ABM0ZGQ6_CAMSA|nr:PREDICTED: paladin-like [Camelina sativa]XP_010515495.1 PREDICTED: paladin-like [Camelina sativa]XP_010515496.1 PREDICTED: paladin-like [Camelina sativa]
MREEPVVYINGKPFVVRHIERPYKNMLEYKRIDRETVEGMEASLKEDILTEAKRYKGAIMVIHEAEDGQILYSCERVDAGSIRTPLEVYKRLEADGFPIKYARVPITDGKALKSSDFDTLTSNIASAASDTAFVFNCQMGNGRTTTGTVIACLVKLRINSGRPIKVLHGTTYIAYPIVDDERRTYSSEQRAEEVRELDDRVFGIDDFLLLWKITRLFDNGVESREALDAVIDRCSDIQNIREAVLQYRKVFNRQNYEPRVRSAAFNRGTEYLERYFRLIAFAAYLGKETLDGSFKKWLHHQKPEVLQAMKKWRSALFFYRT